MQSKQAKQITNSLYSCKVIKKLYNYIFIKNNNNGMYKLQVAY